MIGDAVLRADSSCLDRQRTGAFVEFLQDCRLKVCNTWTREVLSTRREWSSVKFDVPVGSETQCDFVLVSAGTHFSEVEVMKDIDFSSDHWPVSVLCEHAKRANYRRNERVGAPRTPRVPLWWSPADGFVECVNKLDSLQGDLTNQIAGWRAAACDHVLPSSTHTVSEELQDLLSLQSTTKDVVVRRKISKSIWRLRRKERRKRAAALIVSAAEAKRAPGPLLSGCSNHLNWSKVFGVQATIADKVISDFFAEIFEIKDEALMTENATRAAHVENWRCLDPLSKEAGKLIISRDLLDLAIKKLKRGKSFPDDCIAEVYHALPPSARDVLRNGLQGMLDTLSFPKEWTEISAVLIPKCVGPQGLKDYRTLASLCAIRKLLGYVWMLGLPRELPWRSFQAAFLPGRDAAQAVFLVQRCCELSKKWGRPLFVAQLDLKKAFDKAKHSAISDALLSKGVSPHHVAILNSLW